MAIVEDGRKLAFPISFAAADTDLFKSDLRASLESNFQYLTVFMNTYVPRISDGSWQFENPLLLPDGSASQPAVSFSADPDTGIYRGGANDLRFAIGGGEKLRIDAASGVVVSTTLTTRNINALGAGNYAIELGRNDGTAWTPYIDFHTGDAAADFNVRLIASGGGAGNGDGDLTIEAANVNLDGKLKSDLSALSGGPGRDFVDVTVSGDNFWATMVARASGATTLSGFQFWNSDTADVAILQADSTRLKDGSAAAPAVTFISDTNTGLFRQGADAVSLAAGGSERLRATTGSVFVFGTLDLQNNILAAVDEIRASSGSAADPSYTFSSDLDSGMYLSSTGRVSIAVGGVEEFAVTNSVLDVPNVYNSTTASAANVNVDFTGILRRSTSLEDWKEEIEPWQADGSIYDLQPITFYPMAGNPSRDIPMQRCSNERLLGLGARQTGSVNKRFVTAEGDAIDWNAVTAALVAEVQVLRRDFDELREYVLDN